MKHSLGLSLEAIEKQAVLLLESSNLSPWNKVGQYLAARN